MSSGVQLLKMFLSVLRARLNYRLLVLSVEAFPRPWSILSGLLIAFCLNWCGDYVFCEFWFNFWVAGLAVINVLVDCCCLRLDVLLWPSASVRLVYWDLMRWADFVRRRWLHRWWRARHTSAILRLYCFSSMRLVAITAVRSVALKGAVTWAHLLWLVLVPVLFGHLEVGSSAFFYRLLCLKLSLG